MSADAAQVVLSQLVGCWEGTLRRREAADQPFEEFPGRLENRWVLGGRFVEMTLRGGPMGDGWSALFYIGYERNERRYVLVSLEPGDRRVTIRRGEWSQDPGRLVLTSHTQNGVAGQDLRSHIVCDCRIPGRLKLELAERTEPDEEFVRFRADYRTAICGSIPPHAPRQHRRFVIA